MIASAKEIDALNITLFNSCINFTNVHLCNYCTKIFVIIVNTCVCRRSVDNKALILSYPNTTGILQKKKTMWFIGVEVEQETSAPPPKKNPGSAPAM